MDQIDCRWTADLHLKQIFFGKNSLCRCLCCHCQCSALSKVPMPIAATQTRLVPSIAIYRLFEPAVPSNVNGPAGRQIYDLYLLERGAGIDCALFCDV